MDSSNRERTQTCLLAHMHDGTGLMEAFGDFAHPSLLLKLSVFADPFELARNMSKFCRLVVSSSLHGLIVSDALQIPSVRWKAPSDASPTPLAAKVNADFKYYDYFTGIDYHHDSKDAVSQVPHIPGLPSSIAASAETRTGPRIDGASTNSKAWRWLSLLNRTLMR